MLGTRKSLRSLKQSPIRSRGAPPAHFQVGRCGKPHCTNPIPVKPGLRRGTARAKSRPGGLCRSRDARRLQQTSPETRLDPTSLVSSTATSLTLFNAPPSVLPRSVSYHFFFQLIHCITVVSAPLRPPWSRRKALVGSCVALLQRRLQPSGTCMLTQTPSLRRR